ncbi:MAG: 3-oxoacyl-ACP synthase, partial [Gammaproteobacteria bacterium]|nr:3-oxoacyl-ACP synthase [Gammaproteobacteria bacterium]
DHFIFHQANEYILEHLRDKIDIPKEKFYIDLASTGNTVSSTIPIALKNAFSKNIIKSGDILGLIGFGVGYSWGGCILKVDFN